MWFISKRLHKQIVKAKENDIRELTSKIEKLESSLEDGRDNSQYLQNKYNYLLEKRLFEMKQNAKAVKSNADAEKIINRIEFMIKDKKNINEKTTMHIKKLVKDYHTHN